ncbi:MAG TPA: ABC transporter permease [Candidatus Acidoferrales bacterium]|nr:ABC transporter permease [Candidatus Acidoferrales bacterium]
MFAGMFRRMFRRERKATDFGAEIQSHIQLEEERLREQGLSPEEAHNRAYRAFGNVTKTQERFYESRHWLFFDHFWADVRYAGRMLRKSPSFTLAAILTLAMAIGANAVVFSVMNALVLNPLHVPQEESLYAIQHGDEASCFQSYPDYLDLRDRNKSFEGLAAANADQAGLDTGETTSSVWLFEVSGNYFDVLSVHPYLGRLIHPSDEHGPNSAPYAVLSYAYWHTHFGDDPAVVGRVVQLNKHPFTIVGVAQPGFHGTLVFFNVDLFVPIVNAGQVNAGNDLNTRARRWVFITLGHLKAGLTKAQAVADLNSIGAQLEKAYPKDDEKRTFALARPALYGDFLGNPIRAFMTALMLLSGLILLAACANLGSLFAARAADRSRELALRLALGASRLRILRQLFTEAILLSLAGGAVGLWGSIMLLHGLSNWQPLSRWPMGLPVNPDVSVYGMALLLTVTSGFLFGAVPVRQVLRTDPYGVVKAGSLAKTGRRISIREALLSVQIAICAVLVTSSFVAVRGLLRSLHGNFGFEPQNTLIADTDLAMPGYKGDAISEMQRRIIDALKTVPGIDSVGWINIMPLVAGGLSGASAFPDQAVDFRPSKAAADSFMFSVSPGYFHAAGTDFLMGRDITWSDDEKSPDVAVVNRFFARKIFGSETKALGRYFKLLRAGQVARIQVVGVVEDGKYQKLTEDPQPAVFLPLLQRPSSQSYWIMRSSRDPSPLVSAIRRTVRRLDPGLPLYVETSSHELDTALFAPRMAAISLGVLGIMGAMLSITGVFGMASYAVTKRKRELGIRIALGAYRKEVLKAALGRAIKLLAFGSIAGLILGILASRVLAAVVFEATPRDPLVLAGVVLAMAFVGLVATWIPAHRALAIDPAMLLREE